LQRLTLLTYADIHAVNPEALTPWKAEMLWQLFGRRPITLAALWIATACTLRMKLRCWLSGNTRRNSQGRDRAISRGLPAAVSRGAFSGRDCAALCAVRKLAESAVQAEVAESRHVFSLTLLRRDRPALFATISGVLAGWGMNIVKADAFANAAGVVLDTFQFTDLFRTLEFESGRGRAVPAQPDEVVSGQTELEPLLKSRQAKRGARQPKVNVQTRINFDDAASAQSTLMEIVAQDHPGLLHEIAAVLARSACQY